MEENHKIFVNITSFPSVNVFLKSHLFVYLNFSIGWKEAFKMQSLLLDHFLAATVILVK